MRESFWLYMIVFTVFMYILGLSMGQMRGPITFLMVIIVNLIYLVLYFATGKR